MYPNHFYFSQKTLEVRYSHIPSGEISVDRLIKNQPYWKLPITTSPKKPKTLILADWTMANWSIKKQQEVISHLISLIEAGFPVYLWQDGQIELITITNCASFVTDLRTAERVTPTTSNNLEKQMICQLPEVVKDQLLILDDYQVNGLLDPTVFTTPRELDCIELINSKFSLHELRNVLLKTTPPIIGLTDSFFSEQNYEQIKKIEELIPEIPLTSNYDKATLTGKMVEELLEKNQIKIKGRIFSIRQLNFLEYVTLEGVSSQTLQKILPFFPILNKIHLLDFHESELNFDEQIQFPHLEQIKVTQSTMKGKTLAQFLVQSPKIKTLFLNHGSYISGDFKIEKYLTSLETVRLSRTQFPGEKLRALISQSAIKRLVFANGPISNNILTEDIEVPSLESLEIINCESRATNLNQMLVKFRNLKSLILKKGIIYSGNPLNIEFALAQLTTLKINMNMFNSWSSAFNKAPLQKLILNDENGNSLLINPDSFNFNKLKYFGLNKNNLNIDNLKKLLLSATQLTHLDLQECRNLDKVNEALHLNSVETLDLANTDITDKALIFLLNHAPKLKLLDLSGCINLNITIDLQKYLMSIKKVYLPSHIKSTQKEKDPGQFANIDFAQEVSPNSLMGGLGLNDLTYPMVPDNQSSSNRDLHSIAPGISSSKFRTEQFMDADTSHNANKEFNVKRVFFPILPSTKMPNVGDYRFNIFNSVTIRQDRCSIDNAFILKKSGDLKLGSCNPLICSEDDLQKAMPTLQDKNKDYYLGKYTLILSNTWHPLPSLSSAEQLTHYSLTPPIEAEVQYSQQDNQYYIRSTKTNQRVTINYIIEVSNNLTVSIPQAVEELILFFRGFGNKSLVINEEKATGEDYIQAIIEQKTGSCRHRTLAFFHLMKIRHPEISVRIVANDCHSKVEIESKGQRCDVDLGGYSAKLNIYEDNTPDKPESALSPQPQTNNHLPEEDAPISTDDPVQNPHTILSKQLETWNKVKVQPLSVKQYCKKLTQPDDTKKYLIDVPNQSAGEAFLLAIKNFCNQTHHRFYYIDSPEDLVCSGRYIENQDGKGCMFEGPGGPLHDFLTNEENVKNTALLLVNYQNFKADDIVRLNKVVDDERNADGTPLPHNMVVIGIINSTDPNSYQGEDFYSRFDKVEICPFSEEDLSLAYPHFIKEVDKATNPPPPSINLFNMPNWQERLLGKWTISKNSFHFHSGELVKVLEHSATIGIQNGPWNDKSFEYFWKQAFVNGFIEFAGQRITLPPNFKIVEQEGYDWDTLLINLNLKIGIAPTACVLNPTLLTSFFTDYDLDPGNKTLDRIPGILEKNAGKFLTVNLTRSLSEDEWAMILTECDKLNIKLLCHVMSGVKLPDWFRMEMSESPEPIVWDSDITAPLVVIESTDCDTTIAQISSSSNDWIYINASELEASDILTRIDCFFNQEQSRFEFSKTERILLQALKENKKIILTGDFNTSFIDCIMPLILSRQTEENPLGTLVIIYDSKEHLFPNTVYHHVTAAEKRKILSAAYEDKTLKILSDDDFKGSLSQLKARVRHYLAHNEIGTDAAWSGLAGLPPHGTLPQFDLNNSREKTDYFIGCKLEQIWNVLCYSPFIYLSGLTGVGKSTFVEQYIGSDPNVAFYQDVEELKNWALDSSDKTKIIFFDEANIGSRKWSEFEGLFHNPPGIEIDGVYYPLTDKHKVIFAGNPANYGNERQIAPLFARHGNALVFNAMPVEFIYETVLKPIFKGTTLESRTQELSEIYLSLYRYIVNLSHKEVLISARELQMMALQTLVYHQQFPQEDIRAVAANYTYEIGKTLVPETQFKEFSQKFNVPALERVVIHSQNKTQGSFVVTPSRQLITDQLNDLLYLRQYRQNGALNDAQNFGGIGGIILEGEPGIGKSELVINTLIAHQFKEGALNKVSTEGNIFYRVLVSMQLDDKKALLLKAFNEGAVVIIDEINSSPMMERWLNDLLMGKNPLTKQRPKCPGFLIIGTQNPVTMAGRRRPGNALARRLITTVLAPYSEEEMVSILIEKGIEPKLAHTMVEIYNIKLEEARLKNLNPAPTFRDLLRTAKNYYHALTKEAICLFTQYNYTALLESLLKNNHRLQLNSLSILRKNASSSVFQFFNAHPELFERFISSDFPEEKLVALIKLITMTQEKFDFISIREVLLEAESISSEELSVVIENFNIIYDFCLCNKYPFYHFLNKSKSTNMEMLCGFMRDFGSEADLVINLIQAPECTKKGFHLIKIILEILDQPSSQREFFLKHFSKLSTTHLEVLSQLGAALNENENSYHLLLASMLNKPEEGGTIELFNTLSIFEKLGANFSTIKRIRNQFNNTSSSALRLINEYLQHENKALELLKEIQNNKVFSLKAIIQYTSKYQEHILRVWKSGVLFLTQIHLISKWLQQSREDKDAWLSQLLLVWPQQTITLSNLLRLSFNKDKSVFLNVLCSKVLNLLKQEKKDAGLLVLNYESIHNGSAWSHFELSDSIAYSEERVILLKHLEQETFVASNSSDPQCWTQEKNAEFLDFIYTQYSNAFKRNVNQANKSQLLVISEELNKANLQASNGNVSPDLKKALTLRISNYQNCFWIRRTRRGNASQLMNTISKSTHFMEIVKAIHEARKNIIFNDTHQEKNMHRRGKSRYYAALNEMEDLLLQHWTHNPESLAEFKVYHDEYKKSLDYNFGCYIEALNFESKGKNSIKDRSIFISDYSANDLDILLTPDKSSPGYLHALAREVKEMINTRNKFDLLHHSKLGIKPS